MCLLVQSSKTLRPTPGRYLLRLIPQTPFFLTTRKNDLSHTKIGGILAVDRIIDLRPIATSKTKIWRLTMVKRRKSVEGWPQIGKLPTTTSSIMKFIVWNSIHGQISQQRLYGCARRRLIRSAHRCFIVFALIVVIGTINPSTKCKQNERFLVWTIYICCTND